MRILSKIFIAINIIYVVYGTYFMSKQRTISGKSGLSTPGGWIPVWQGIGVVIIFTLSLSPWHLIWWWPIGILGGAQLIWLTLTRIGVVKDFRN